MLYILEYDIRFMLNFRPVKDMQLWVAIELYLINAICLLVVFRQI